MKKWIKNYIKKQTKSIFIINKRYLYESKNI